MAKREILISIITASFNSGSKLLQTYASIACQKVHFEYLIIDGASTDGSREIGEKLADDDKRVRFFSEPDNGVYDAMNKAIGHAIGDYFYFIGAGDLLISGSLGQIIELLPTELNSLVYGDCELGGKRYFGKCRKYDLAFQNICHQAIFYGRAVFAVCGNYDLQFRAWADWDLNMRCFGNRRIKKIYAPVVVAVFELGGLSTPGDDQFRSRRRQLIRSHLGIFTILEIRLRPRYERLMQVIRQTLRTLRK